MVAGVRSDSKCVEKRVTKNRIYWSVVSKNYCKTIVKYLILYINSIYERRCNVGLLRVGVCSAAHTGGQTALPLPSAQRPAASAVVRTR